MTELQRNLYVLRRWWWLLLVALILGGLLAYGLTKVLVQQKYEGTAVISMAPPPVAPNGLYVTMLPASADAQLVPSLATAQGARASLPPKLAQKIDPSKLSNSIDSTASVDGQLLFVKVRWADEGIVPSLTNAVAGSFIGQERQRLEARYQVIHRTLTAQEGRLARLAANPQGTGQARSWLQARYADDASKAFQQDAVARVQASTQQTSLQLAEPAVSTTKAGPKPLLNGLLGAALALLIALVFAFVATRSYGEAEEPQASRPVLTKVGE